MGRVSRLAGFGGGHGRFPHQRRGREHGGVLGGGDGHGGSSGKLFNPCPHIPRQIVHIEFNGSVRGDMGDDFIVAVLQLQTIPDRDAVAMCPKPR